jgi:hypothetical protein
MTTLTEFLLARIAEDEDVAQMAPPGPWKVRYGPARVLAECEAKRQIVANTDKSNVERWGGPLDGQASSEDGPARAYWRGQEYVCSILAAVYADHPDYREEWKP